MEKENSEDRSKVVLAIILIAIGGIWLFRQVGLHYFLTEPFFHPFALMFGQLGKIIFSWQVIMIIVGLALLAGNRNGWVLIIIGAIFLVPKIFIIPAFSFALMLPILLIVAGIVMIIRKN